MNEVGKAGKEHRLYVRVSGDPADIGHAGEPVIGMEIEDILDGQRCAEYVPSRRVYDTLRLSRGTGGLQGVKELCRR